MKVLESLSSLVVGILLSSSDLGGPFGKTHLLFPTYPACNTRTLDIEAGCKRGADYLKLAYFLGHKILEGVTHA